MNENGRIPLLTILLDGELHNSDIPLFRGAVIHSMGVEADVLFHNHQGNEGYRYRYPLIQYKRLHGHPAIVCISEGVDAIGQFLSKEEHSLRIGHRQRAFSIQEQRRSNFEIAATNVPCCYTLHQWLALNEENYKVYMQEDSLIVKISLLERILTGNLLSMLKGVGITALFPLEVTITKLNPPYSVMYKKMRHAAFDVTFNANLLLPDYIGLGKNVSIGFGTLYHDSQS